MRAICTVLTVFFFCFFSICSQGQEKYSQVAIKITDGDKTSFKKFLFDSLEADHFSFEKGIVTIDLNQQQLQTLQRSGYTYELLVDDIAEHFRQTSSITDFYAHDHSVGNRSAYETTGLRVTDIIQTPGSFTAGSMNGYYTYAEMISKIDALVAAYPTIISKVSIGTTYLGNTIWGVKVSDNVSTDEAEPEVLYTGLQHAREAITGTSLIFFMQYLCERYNSDDQVRSLVNNREFYIIPCVNVDGYLYNQSTNPAGGGMWRKNRRLNSGGSYGVDINRNYGIDWGCCSGGSATQTDETYWGTAAFSEPETQAIRNFVTSRNFVIGFDQHCYGPYYSLPFGIESNHTLNAIDTRFFTYMPALIGKYNGHRAGNSIQTVGYNVAGGIKDWLLLGDINTGTKGKIYGWTGEAGGGGFWAPTSSIIPLSKELCFQNLQIAYTAGSYADIQDVNDISVSSTSGTFAFQVRRIGLEDQPITVTAIPINNIQSVGGPVTINSLANYHDTYTGNISFTLPSSISSGKRIRFVWKVETGGITFYDTVTKFYNPVTLFSDDMEGSLSGNWVLPSGGSASNKWGFESIAGGGYSGSKVLSESVGGDYPSNATRWVQYKNTVNLSDATAAYLSFWVRHRAENFRDKLQVQISSDGSTWISLHGKNTVCETNTTNEGTLGGLPALTGIKENWTREIMDLSSYTGAGYGTVSLRFLFTSDGDGGNFYKERDEGFYLDNVTMVKSTSSLVTLPVHFLSFEGRLTSDATVELKWNAITDNQHDYFELQKSADLINFQTIGRIDDLPPCFYSDRNPFIGNNYYRVKQVDKDGTITYSKVVTISYRPASSFTFKIYPTPAANRVFVKMTGGLSDRYTFTVNDLSGRQLLTKTQFLSAGGTEELDVSRLAAQTYILTIYNNKYEIVATEKLIRQ